MIELLVRTVMMGTPLLYGSLSEVYAERSGVMNTAIEGIFLMGAWAGFVAAYQTGGNLAIGLLAAIIAGVLTAMLYGWITVYLKQHQIVTGTALNILALGICAFFQRVIFGVPTSPLIVQPLQPIPIPVLSQIPVIGPILFDQNILTYWLFILVPLANFVLFKTSLGLSVRSVGENPEAGDVAGLRVDRLRFGTILFAGIMCGIGGAFYSIGYLGMFTTTIIGGRGWIAFAICFLGNWQPARRAGRHAGLRPGRSHCHLHAVQRHGPVPERVVHCPAVHPDDRADRLPQVVQRPREAGSAIQERGLASGHRAGRPMPGLASSPVSRPGASSPRLK